MYDHVSEEKQMEIQRLTQKLSHMEQELLEKYCDAGKLLLEKAEEESREIDRLVDEVIQVKQELVRVKGEKRCPNCYHYNEAESMYCSKCGTKLEEEREENHDQS